MPIIRLNKQGLNLTSPREKLEFLSFFLSWEGYQMYKLICRQFSMQNILKDPKFINVFELLAKYVFFSPPSWIELLFNWQGKAFSELILAMKSQSRHMIVLIISACSTITLRSPFRPSPPCTGHPPWSVLSSGPSFALDRTKMRRLAQIGSNGC